MRMPSPPRRESRRPSRRAALPALALAASLLAAPAMVSLPGPAFAQEDDVLIHKKKEAREKREQRIERNLRMRDTWQGKTPDAAGARNSPKLSAPPEPQDRSREDR